MPITQSTASNGVPMLYSSGTTGQPKGVFVPPSEQWYQYPHPTVASLRAAFGFSETVYLSPRTAVPRCALHYNMMAQYQGHLRCHGASIRNARYN